MSFEINWSQILQDWLDPRESCQMLTESLNKMLPENSPVANLRVKQFDLQACPAPEIELIDVCEIRDEFLLAAGLCRSIQSPPPSDSAVDFNSKDYLSESGRIDAASLLYTKPSASFKDAILQDGVEAVLQFSFKSDAIRIEFEADAVLNMPTPAFLALPLKFTLTQLKIDGKVTLALPTSLDRVFLAFPVPLNEFDFQISVDVGEADKHVLRNVAKIERFLLEQIRIFINDRMILPQFIELPLKKQEL